MVQYIGLALASWLTLAPGQNGLTFFPSFVIDFTVAVRMTGSSCSYALHPFGHLGHTRIPSTCSSFHCPIIRPIKWNGPFT